MDREGETEVFLNFSLELGKCYEMIIPTRSQYIPRDVRAGDKRFRLFSTNQPSYLGEFVRKHTFNRPVRGPLGTMTSYYIFNDGGKENKIERYFSKLPVCFNEVPCKLHLNSKATNQSIRNVYESKTGQSAAPGTGPANLIRAFTGVRVPRGAEGGRRTRRKNKKSKKTRSRK